MLSIKTVNVVQNGNVVRQAEIFGRNEDVENLPTEYAVGSSFFNLDTQEVFMWNGTEWGVL